MSFEVGTLPTSQKNQVLVNGGMFLNVKPLVSHSKTSPNSATPKIIPPVTLPIGHLSLEIHQLLKGFRKFLKSFRFRFFLSQNFIAKTSNAGIFK